MDKENRQEEYLTPEELSQRIKLSVGTIRNFVSKKRFRRGFHYVKPARKLLFVWSRIEKDWLYQDSHIESEQQGRQSECRVQPPHSITATINGN